MTTLLALSIVATTAFAQGLPRDPFQRCAIRALRGDFGKLAEWQRRGYARGLALGVTCNTRVWLTGYYATEGRQGQTDRRGRPCTRRTAAANLVSENAWVWCEAAAELRQVRDCGAHRNDAVARRKGARLWIDYWYRYPRRSPFGGSCITRAAVAPPRSKH